MKKRLILAALVLAALLSSCGREAVPAVLATTIETTAETTMAPLPSRSELPSETTAVPTTTAAAETTARITATAQTGTVTTTTAVTKASTAVKTTSTAKSTAVRYVYTNNQTTTAKPSTAQSTTATTTLAPTTYSVPLGSASAKRAETAVSFAIDGSAAVPHGYNVSLPAQSIALNSGESVLDLLRRSGVAAQTRGSGRTAYVIGIGGLQEKACGGTSGWIYEVNGARPSVSCGVYEPKDGDVIVWRYTLTV